jgi:cytoskeletal protein CcmA (bactofilin family)
MMFKRGSPGGSSKRSVDTLVGRGTRIDGDVIFSGGLHLDGQVSGNVRADGDAPAFLIVSEQGRIDGSVEVTHVVLNGAVTGDVLARERVELGPQARINGNVHYGVIEMAPGAQINGKLIHQPVDAAPASDPTAPGQ